MESKNSVTTKLSFFKTDDKYFKEGDKFGSSIIHEMIPVYDGGDLMFIDIFDKNKIIGRYRVSPFEWIVMGINKIVAI